MQHSKRNTTMTPNNVIKKLTEYFNARDDIIMAFLFGSHAEAGAHSGSDWDVAVYITPLSYADLEYEQTDKDYPQEDGIWFDLTRILKTDNVDLIILNRAPANIADSAIRGRPLIIKDQDLWLRFMLVITSLAEDFREFSRNYYEIYQRSSSLSPKDAERIARIIEFIENQMTLYEIFAPLTFGEYEADLIRRGAVERWVENVINAISDVSKIVLSSSKKPISYGYADTVHAALLYFKLPEETWNEFLKWIKLRNILAHEYLDIKWKRISSFIHESEPYVKSFVESAKSFYQSH